MKKDGWERIGKRTKRTKAKVEIITLTLTVKLRNNRSVVPVLST